MAHKRKRVGEVSTAVWVLGGIAVLGIGFLIMNQSKPATTTVVRPAVPSTSATTAAEIAAGASVVNTLVNDLTPDEEDS
jgi:hypothetical protein